jgi:predicted nucleic acid-binding protein
MRYVVLDNEAVAALRDPAHRRHSKAVAHLEGIVARRGKGVMTVAVVPTTVRVEASWNRRSHSSAFINRFPIRDAVLDGPSADVAAEVVTATRVSVADAHIGALARSLSDDEVVVLTSDPSDIVRASSPVTVTAVRL